MILAAPAEKDVEKASTVSPTNRFWKQISYFAFYRTPSKNSQKKSSMLWSAH